MKDGTVEGKGWRLHQEAGQAAPRGLPAQPPRSDALGRAGVSIVGRGAKVSGRSSRGVWRSRRCLGGGGGGGRGRLSALLTDVMGFPSVINDSHLRAE